MSISEKNIWVRTQLFEKFGIQHDLDTKDIHEFAQLVKKLNPPRINVAIAEMPITAVGIPVHNHELADYLEYSSVFTFPITQNGKTLAKYIETYEESRISIAPSLHELDNVIQRALLTATNRSSQLCAEISSSNTDIYYRFSSIDHLETLSQQEIETIKRQALERKLRPFII